MSIITRRDHERNTRQIRESFCCHPDCEDVPWPAARAPLCWAHMLDVAGQVMLEMNDREPEDLHCTEPSEPIAQPEGAVYFMRLGAHVKIGFTTNLSQRLAAIPHEELLGSFAGTLLDEKRCHAIFADLRARDVSGREWFHMDQRILDFIAERAA